ncbi:MAG: V-type ATP synthase subunit I [Treponema sp.]|nr:V-type ATP synthase subunit I [Treponema sp.]
MKKVYLVMQEKHREDALVKLREVGVMHIESEGATSDGVVKAHEHKVRLDNAISLIQPYKVSKKQAEAQERGAEDRKQAAGRRGRRATDLVGSEETEPYSLDAINAPVRPDLIDLMLGIDKERKALGEQLALLIRERDRIASWGEFNPDTVKELAALGYPMHLYELSPGALTVIPQDINYIKLSQDKVLARIAALEKTIPGMPVFHLPEKSLSCIEAEIAELTTKLEALETRMQNFVDRRPILEREMLEVQSEIEFENALAELKGMDGVPSEFACSCLKGYILADDLGKLKRTAADNGWALTAYDPGPDDAPPTKIKSGALARIIHPLFSFLGTVPGYREFDISPSYLVFFCIFFAMILGDAGYGLLMFALAAIIGISAKKKSGTFPDVAKLLMLLTFTTVVWGTVNGAWFAIPREHLPPVLISLILPPFNPSGPVMEFPLFLQNVFKLPAEVPVDELKSRWYIQFLCFSLAVTQLVYARGKRIINLLPSLTAFAQLGTLLMLLGLYFLVLNMLLGIELPPFALWLIIAGVAFNLIFTEQKGGNFFVNIGKGFGSFIQIFLKAVGCFADIISYLRLFAVGFAGAMVAQIFNGMAMPADGLGSFGLAFLLKLITAVLILVTGHGLNLLLTALSVIVHGVRLNLLEYAGNHLEMEWSGYLYNPFALKQKKE